jgi:propanol-preferring alcohol dehydrogenase
LVKVKAYRITAWGTGKLQDIDVPKPGHGQVLVEVRSAGLCRTDLNILGSEGGYWPNPPFTLGHEVAGVVAELGPGVVDVAVGDPVLVSAIYFCGACSRCRRGRDHECERMTHVGYGVGIDGGLAEYIVAEAIHVFSLGDLDPVSAAPLGDAAATAYHAVMQGKASLWPGAKAAVIGVGGLGAYAVQYLTQLTGASVIAFDTVEDRLSLAKSYGAEAVAMSGDGMDSMMRDFGAGKVDLVYDFVGNTQTVSAGLASIGSGGAVIVAGIGGAEVVLGWERMPRNSRFENTRGYTRADLQDVLALASAGRLDVPQTHYPLSKIEEALEDVRAARVSGRAVVLPGT